MAGLPKRPCRHQGCVDYALDGKRFCAAHYKEHENMRKRESRAERGRPWWSRLYDRPEWKDRKAAFLRRNPLCAECAKFNVVRGAEVVDHIVPHCGDMELFWDESNWQPLCAQCHNEKTAREDGGFGNTARRAAVNSGRSAQKKPERLPLRLG